MCRQNSGIMSYHFTNFFGYAVGSPEYEEEKLASEAWASFSKRQNADKPESRSPPPDSTTPSLVPLVPEPEADNNDQETLVGASRKSIVLDEPHIQHNQVLSAITLETEYQEKKSGWGDGNNTTKPSLAEELILIEHYLDKAKAAYATQKGNAGTLDQLRKVTAQCWRCQMNNGVVFR